MRLDRDENILEHIVAHSYGTVDPEITWEIMQDDIPALREYCEKVLGGESL